MRRLFVLAALFLSLPAQAVTIDWVPIGDPNNLPDTPSTNCYAANCGSVDHAYFISKYETTNAQYAEFLNAVAASDDPFGLYNPAMRISLFYDLSTGMFVYYVPAGFENNPVISVSWYDAARFTNWLHNGQPTGEPDATTTEDGAYTFGGAETVGGRNGGALTFLPTENEWYKAAYYDATSATYFDYAMGTNEQPTAQAPPELNSANFYNSTSGYAVTGSTTYDQAINYLTDVGAYNTGSASPYGTFDQSGNVEEWNEQTVSDSFRGYRGGSWALDLSYVAASSTVYGDPTIENDRRGFRAASLVPEPGPGLLGTMGLLSVLGLATIRRRRAH
jgi:formylglycine-generating enzyme required for sulfatase activity